MVALCVASIIILHLHVASSNTTTFGGLSGEDIAKERVAERQD